MKKMKNRNINLYERLRQSEEKGKSKKKSAKFKIIVFGCAIAGVSGIAILASNLYLDSVTEKYNEMYFQVNSPVLLDTISKDDIYIANNAALEKIKLKYEEKDKIISKSALIPEKLTPNLIKTILSCQKDGVTIYEISFDGTSIYISGVSLYADKSADFVNELENKDLFTKIDYAGFDGQGGQYIFNVNAVLATAGQRGNS